jgi:hypothetical protein
VSDVVAATTHLAESKWLVQAVETTTLVSQRFKSAVALSRLIRSSQDILHPRHLLTADVDTVTASLKALFSAGDRSVDPSLSRLIHAFDAHSAGIASQTMSWIDALLNTCMEAVVMAGIRPTSFFFTEDSSEKVAAPLRCIAGNLLSDDALHKLAQFLVTVSTLLRGSEQGEALRCAASAYSATWTELQCSLGGLKHPWEGPQSTYRKEHRREIEQLVDGLMGWHWLTFSTVESLRSSQMLRLSRCNPSRHDPHDAFNLWVIAKNVGAHLSIKVYDIDLVRYLKEKGQNVHSSLDLAGLSASIEFSAALCPLDLAMQRVCVEIPGMEGRRGCFVVDVSAGGQMCRLVLAHLYVCHGALLWCLSASEGKVHNVTTPFANPVCCMPSCPSTTISNAAIAHNRVGAGPSYSVGRSTVFDVTLSPATQSRFSMKTVVARQHP